MHSDSAIIPNSSFPLEEQPPRASSEVAAPVAGKPAGFRLVGPEFVAKLLADPKSARDSILLEAHFSSLDHPLDPDRPSRHHIPGAIQVHPSYLEAGDTTAKYYPWYDCPSDGNVLKGCKLTGLLERLGITPGSDVVVYGTEPDGTMAAARLVWGLMYAGVEHVQLLDGGIDAWVEYGGATDGTVKTVCDVTPARVHGLPQQRRWRSRPEYLATTAEVREIVSGRTPSNDKLVDVRRRGEWDGSLTDYYRFYSEAGHIPTAIHQGDWDNLLEPGTHKLGPCLGAVADRWRRLGIIDSDIESGNSSLIFYCGTGWRSSIAFLAAHLLGLRARNYDDGFFGWSWEGRNPVATRESS